MTEPSLPPDGSMLDWALWHAAQGRLVFPCHTPHDGLCSCGRPKCESPGKHPRTSHGVKDATVNEARVREWWTMWPDANIGIAAGIDSGIVVLDVDLRHGGDESLADLEKEHGSLPETRTVISGTGGPHVYLRHPGGDIPNSNGKLGPGLDVRSDGGYVIAEPSLHLNGRRYVRDLGADGLAQAPPWLFNLMRSTGARKEKADGSARAARVEDVIPEGRRNDTLTSLAGSMRRKGMSAEAIFAALLVENRDCCQPPLPEDEVRRIAESVARYVPASAAGNRTPAPTVVIPGEHAGQEVGADDFAQEVLKAIPPGVMYRWDCIVGRIIGEVGERRFARLTDHEMRTVVDEHCRLVRLTLDDEGNAEETFVACNRDLAALVLAAAGSSSRVRALSMITRYPVYQPGFTLVSPGWNDSGIFYDEPSTLTNLTPCPQGALEVLDELVVDFPFAVEEQDGMRCNASRYNVHGAGLTLLLRPAIEGPIPIHLVMAPMERTGKGLLIDTAIGCPILGRGVTVMQLGSSEEEREKRITAMILQGMTAIHLDNLPISEILDSASLASLTTSYPTWSGRVLGVSRLPELPNRVAVIMSGNNPRASGEIVKRTVPIVLQPLDAHPEDRTGYAHPDATGYALSMRRAVLQAYLGLIEAWKEAGCPPAPADRRLGRFERWVAVVGGVLAHAGCRDWLGNYKAWVRCADEATADAETLVTAWWDRHGDNLITAAEILSLVEETGTYPAVMAVKETGRLVSLSKRVLTPLTDRPVAGWIVRRIGYGSGSRYQLGQTAMKGGGGSGGSVGSPPPTNACGDAGPSECERRETPDSPRTPTNEEMEEGDV